MKLRLCKIETLARFSRLYSNDRRKVMHAYSKFDPSHPYINLFPWKTRDQFVDVIQKSIIHNEGGLIAINKPFGVPVNIPGHDDSNPKTVTQTMTTVGLPECEYSIAEILPILKTRLDLQSLSIVKSPERYTSGVMLLASSQEVENKIRKAFRRSLAKQMPTSSYWALTTYIPQIHEKKHRVGIRLVEVKEFNQKVPIIETKISKKAVSNQSVTPVVVEMKMLTCNKFCNTALVEVATSKTTMHFLRVYLAYKLAPILGDGMYSSRVKLVLGKPVTVSPYNKAAYDTKDLSENLSRKLQMPQNKTGSIPNHLHLHQVILDGYANKQDLILSSSPPEYFTWSLSQLGLQLKPQLELARTISN